MSTRARIVILDGDGKEICVIYHHWDGYLSYLGRKLCEFLLGDGYASKPPHNPGKQWRGHNGMGCLAAQLVAYLKKGIGNVYLEPAGTRFDEEYLYTIYSVGYDKPPRIKAEHYTGVLFFDTFPAEALEFCTDEYDNTKLEEAKNNTKGGENVYTGTGYCQ